MGVLAGKVAEYFRPRLPRHASPITLKVDAPGPGPTVLGDPVLLEWALENLVKNALDALQGKSGAITLSAHARNGSAELRVVDDGPGISREVRRTLFEPGITTKCGGWGIGLALTRRVVEDSHGGELVLELARVEPASRDPHPDCPRACYRTPRPYRPGHALNPAQREAVEHEPGPLLVLAGAGSGKTRVLTTRIAHLIDEHGVPPERIFAVTFTNKAAGEMKHRIGQLLDRDPSGLWIGTFHSLSARLLRREAERLGFTRQFTIYDEDDRLALIRRPWSSSGPFRSSCSRPSWCRR